MEKITAKSLQDDHEKNLKDLQSTCKHNDISNWMDHMWAAGHYSGYQVKQCNTCWKIISIKTNCNACRKEIIYDNPDDFAAWKEHLCNNCLKKGKHYCIAHNIHFDDKCPECEKFIKLCNE